MGKSSGPQDMVTVSFKLTTAEHNRLVAIVEAHPFHESVPDFVQELVRNSLEVAA